MKTTLFAVLVAMMGSSNAVRLSEISAGGQQENLSQANAVTAGGDDDCTMSGMSTEGCGSDENYAEADSSSSTSGHATAHGATVSSTGLADADVSSETYNDEANGEVTVVSV